MGAQKWLYAIYKVWSSLKPNKWGIYWGYCRAMKFRSWVNSNGESKKQIMACLCLVNLHWILTSNAGIGWTLCLGLLTKLSRPQTQWGRFLPQKFQGDAEQLSGKLENPYCLMIPKGTAPPSRRSSPRSIGPTCLPEPWRPDVSGRPSLQKWQWELAVPWWTGAVHGVEPLRMRRSCWCRAYLASEICGNPQAFASNVRIKGPPRGRI